MPPKVKGTSTADVQAHLAKTADPEKAAMEQLRAERNAKRDAQIKQVAERMREQSKPKVNTATPQELRASLVKLQFDLIEAQAKHSELVNSLQPSNSSITDVNYLKEKLLKEESQASAQTGPLSRITKQIHDLKEKIGETEGQLRQLGKKDLPAVDVGNTTQRSYR